MIVNFDNTEVAYSYLSNRELKKKYYIFSILNSPLLSEMGKKFTLKALDVGLPIKKMVKDTIFQAFVGGETLKETEPDIFLLQDHGIGVILDYGVEAKNEEEELDQIATKIYNIIYDIKQQGYTSVQVCAKISAFANNELLEKRSAGEVFTPEEEQLWQAVIRRLKLVCSEAEKNGVQLYIDAEESWIQDAIDELVEQLMATYNQNQVCVIQTIQLYRIDKLEYLKDLFQRSLQQNYKLGVKLVRGAYMEKERKRAIEMDYTSPIQLNKKNTDNDFNQAIDFCIEHHDQLFMCVGSHNEESNYYLEELLSHKDISRNNPNIVIAQLFGMGDYITFNMAKAGYNTYKYLPFGPVKDLLPYLLRRAQENSSVDGQASRELSLLKKEMKRRGLSTWP